MELEYLDYAEYYDIDHTLWSDIDRDFFLGYAGQCGSPILELACGTGRLLIPIAEAGHEVVGLDFNENMLAECRKKVEKAGLEGQFQLVQGNMAEFDLPRRDFGLVFIAFRSFMHLWTQAEQIACLQRAYDHLRPGGLFILDIYAPSFEYLAREPDIGQTLRNKFDLPNGHSVLRWDRMVKIDIAKQINRSEIEYEEFDAEGNFVRDKLIPIYTRFTFRWELQLLLERAGFEVLDVYRDFDKNLFDGTGEIIAVARKKMA